MRKSSSSCQVMPSFEEWLVAWWNGPLYCSLLLFVLLCWSVFGCIKCHCPLMTSYVMIYAGWWRNSAEVIVGRYSCVCWRHHYVFCWRWLFHVQFVKTAEFVRTPCTNYWSLEVIYRLHLRLILPSVLYSEEVEYRIAFVFQVQCVTSRISLTAVFFVFYSCQWDSTMSRHDCV